MENRINCEIKQQGRHMENDLLPTKYAVKTQGKLHPLTFEREQ